MFYFIWYVDRVNLSLQLYLIIWLCFNLLKYIFLYEEYILIVKMYYVYFVLYFILYDLMVIYN